MVLLFGARTPVELLYGDEFRAFADKHPDNFRFVPCFSRELPAAGFGACARGRSPRLRAAVPRGVRARMPAHDIAYLCGNPNMVDACFETLKGYGLPVPQIRREKYVSSK